jgi:ribose-phosphate pyrophosphokinase
LGISPTKRTLERFPDGEVHAVVDAEVRGRSVHLLQPLSQPVNDHLVELAMLADASHRAGAARITAVVPYYGYARQDRRSAAGEAVGARVVADLLHAVHIDAVLVVDPHTPALEAMVGMPLESVNAIGLLTAILEQDVPPNGVVVAPDLGAVKRAQRYAARLELPMAFVRKTRLSGDTVRAEGIVGDVARRVPILVDDMISTGGTILSAARLLLDAGAVPELYVAATHGLFVNGAADRLADLPLRRLLVTDTVRLPATAPLGVETVSTATLLADAISRLHHGQPLGDLAEHE